MASWESAEHMPVWPVVEVERSLPGGLRSTVYWGIGGCGISDMRRARFVASSSHHVPVVKSGSRIRSGGKMARMRSIFASRYGSECGTGGEGTRALLRRYPPCRCMSFHPPHGIQIS
ncbi:hypothetical protein QYE76_010602 [Lolium multiflorum]|uniref:Uncharacterized protein n=1 Tax=Lolium multiflorum TaxID=4521 RepID=A0AAD8X389_LOLMU|nr:hypothetical protein QYE76_010602 [Lolium multiflorum]